MTGTITPEAALDEVSFYFRDLDEEFTLRSWLKMLLGQLWDDREGFDGKRPFGNGGWDADLWAELIGRGIVEGELDAAEAFDEFVAAAIAAL